jgi:hypothetical protein
MDRCEGTFLYLSTRFDVALFIVSKPNGVWREHPKWYFWNNFTGICMQIFPLNSQIFVSSYGFNDERGKKRYKRPKIWIFILSPIWKKFLIFFRFLYKLTVCIFKQTWSSSGSETTWDQMKQNWEVTNTRNDHFFLRFLVEFVYKFFN